MQLMTRLQIAMPEAFAVLPYVCYGFLALLLLAGVVRLALLARATPATRGRAATTRL